jgi:fructose-1,6-bisphosphatase/inositol monophosphatase family enzyme
MSALLERVGTLMREVAAQVIVPRFRALSAGEVEEKSPGELVTVVDREVERLLEHGLTCLLPGARVVGEEGVADDPSRLRGLERGDVWLVDPLDGTGNFVAGQACFAVMVALLRDGETIAAWLLDPVEGTLFRAERGAGAYAGDVRLQATPGSPGTAALRGAVLNRYMPTALRTYVAERAMQLAEALPGTHCAGAEYPSIARGDQDFALFFRTLPWDHAPGALFLTESGGVAMRYDGTPYRATDPRTGLLAARNQAVWEDAHRLLLSGRPAA